MLLARAKHTYYILLLITYYNYSKQLVISHMFRLRDLLKKYVINL